MPQAAPAQQIPVGSLYGLPGFTETFEQYENINNYSTTLAATAQTPFNPPASFQKTDIVKWWELETFFTVTTTSTSYPYTISPYAPWNIFQNFKLKLQGQYSPLEVESGIDLAFWQIMRPMRGKGQQSNNTLGGQYVTGFNPGGGALVTPSVLDVPGARTQPQPDPDVQWVGYGRTLESVAGSHLGIQQLVLSEHWCYRCSGKHGSIQSRTTGRNLA